MDLLVDLLFLWGAIWLVRRLFLPRPPLRAAPRPTPVRRRVRTVSDVVACSQCGLYIPRSESISGPGNTSFCCQEHKTAATIRR
ncbi:MAG: PP0621 family protein [Acidiferrobacter sp.]